VFCNPGQGHEKGGVEGLVGYARRNYMVPIPAEHSGAFIATTILTDSGMPEKRNDIIGQF
jgi:transposase